MKRSIAIVCLAVTLTACSAPRAEAPAAVSTPLSEPVDEVVEVTISGGMDTDPVDGGRPVVLIAAALGVPTEVFREAFSGVTPAGAGAEVSDERARSNKAALMSVLAPYGISNGRLDEVSNFYRYNGSAGEVWQHRAATATYADGVFTVTDPGFGYSSPPTITLSNGQTATATLTFGTDMATNGSIASITLD
jgi:hypothetical protein